MTTVGQDTTEDLGAALEELAGALGAVELRLPFPGADAGEEARAGVVRDIREHLLPRLADREAPLVAAFFGASGSGKSVVVNSLAQEQIGSPGPVRPSTRRAVVWAHRDHAARYWREFLRQVRDRVGPAVETIVGDDPMTRSLTLVDTPPFDLAGEGGRDIARDVLGITDLCVFVSSALRYADADAWAFMELVQRRGVPMLFVLNRLPASPGEREGLVADFAGRLAAAGLLLAPDPALVFAVPEQATDPVHGGVAATSVAALRTELEELTDRDLRKRLSRQATRGAALDLAQRVAPLAAAVTRDRARAAELGALVEEAYDAAADLLEQRLLSGELSGADHPSEAAGQLVTHLAGTAAQQAATAWDAEPVGRALLERHGGSLWRHGADTQRTAEGAFDDWSAKTAAAAAAHVGRGRARRRRRAAALVQAGALAAIPPPDLEKLLGRDTARAVVQEELGALLAALRSALRSDALRFAAAAGDPAGEAEAGRPITAAAERVASAAEGLG